MTKIGVVGEPRSHKVSYTWLLGFTNVIGPVTGLVFPSLTRWCIVASLGLPVREEGFIAFALEPVGHVLGISDVNFDFFVYLLAIFPLIVLLLYMGVNSDSFR